jgi:hypothetical protein
MNKLGLYLLIKARNACVLIGLHALNAVGVLLNRVEAWLGAQARPEPVSEPATVEDIRLYEVIGAALVAAVALVTAAYVVLLWLWR